MKILINILKKIENNLISLEIIMQEEYKNLLNPDTNINKLHAIIKKKEYYLQNILKLNKERIFFEKKYNIITPYNHHNELKNCLIVISERSNVLKKINTKNKTIINKKFFFNQYFLELFLSDQKCITYDAHGKLEF